MKEKMGVGVIWLVEESKEAKKALTAGRVDTREHITGDAGNEAC